MISAANCQSGDEDGCYHEKFHNYVAWAVLDLKKNSIVFAFLGYPSTILRTAYRK